MPEDVSDPIRVYRIGRFEGGRSGGRRKDGKLSETINAKSKREKRSADKAALEKLREVRGCRTRAGPSFRAGYMRTFAIGFISLIKISFVRKFVRPMLSFHLVTYIRPSP